jgi:hypothetical protein
MKPKERSKPTPANVNLSRERDKTVQQLLNVTAKHCDHAASSPGWRGVWLALGHAVVVVVVVEAELE